MTIPTVTVQVFHNMARDAEGRHTAWSDGYTAGDPLTRVAVWELPVWDDPRLVAEDAWGMGNDAPCISDARFAEMRSYRAAGNRSLCVGDVIVVGESPLAVARCGFEPVHPDPATIGNTADYGTAPLVRGE